MKFDINFLSFIRSLLKNWPKKIVSSNSAILISSISFSFISSSSIQGGNIKSTAAIPENADDIIKRVERPLHPVNDNNGVKSTKCQKPLLNFQKFAENNPQRQTSQLNRTI